MASHTALCETVGGDCLHEQCSEDECAVPQVPLDGAPTVLCDDSSLTQTPPHEHSAMCGHVAVIHGNHVDYLVDGQLHHPHGEHDDVHLVTDPLLGDVFGEAGVGMCTDEFAFADHEGVHTHHQVGCGHEPVIHEDHLDFVVDGQLLHPHNGDHLDWHGFLESTSSAASTPSSRVVDEQPAAAASTTALCECGSAAGTSAAADLSAPCQHCGRMRYRLVEPVEMVDDIDEQLRKLIKPEHVAKFSSKMPTDVLQGIAQDFAVQLSAHVMAIGGKCDTVRELAALRDKQMQTLSTQSPFPFRQLKTVRDTALVLVHLEKRRHALARKEKNAACCARFREKKKSKTNALQQAVDEMSSRCDELTRRMEELEHEKRKLLQRARAEGLAAAVASITV